ncbi:MAG: arsenate reductase (glutaredoxin) [Flavobacteriaceae bacterium]|jgi:arsenate reductase
MNLKIYHNPRCRKSREALQYLEETKQSFDIINYIDKRLSKAEIEQLLKELGYQPEELIRKNEAIWKEQYKGKDLSVDELVSALSENPKLIERPIISNGKSAVIARPLEKLIDFLK